MDEHRKVQHLGVRLEEDLFHTLQEVARIRNVPLSHMVRTLITRALDQERAIETAQDAAAAQALATERLQAVQRWLIAQR
jgi:hypothetical protein